MLYLGGYLVQLDDMSVNMLNIYKENERYYMYIEEEDIEYPLKELTPDQVIEFFELRKEKEFKLFDEEQEDTEDAKSIEQIKKDRIQRQSYNAKKRKR